MTLVVVRTEMKERGFVAFTSIIIISAVALAVATSITLLGVGEAKNSLDFKKGLETLKIAESCVDEALLRSRHDSLYSGGTVDVGGGSCSIAVTPSGSDRTFDIVADLNNIPGYTRRVRVLARRAGFSVNVIEWREVE